MRTRPRKGPVSHGGVSPHQFQYCRDTPCRIREVQHFVRSQRPLEDIMLAVGEPLLEHLVASELVAPHGGRNVAPASPVVQVDVERGIAKRVDGSPSAARSSAVYGRGTTRPRPGMTVSPCPKLPQPAVSAKSPPTMFPPPSTDGTATAAISGGRTPSVIPGTGVSESSKAASSRPRAADAVRSFAAPASSPSGQPGSGIRGHPIRKAPALASR